MFSKHIKLLCFLVTLPSLLGSPGTTRPQADANLRGHSFGLENFLFQPFEDEVKPKRVRPVGNQRVPNRGHVYDLENLTAYESSRVPQTVQKSESKVVSSKIRENIINPTTEELDAAQEVITERIKKRITMRRRRKRPQDGSNDVTGNAIQKPFRIPVFPQVSKVVIKTKQPDQETVYRLKPVELKSTLEPDYWVQEEKTVVEKSTVKSTTPTTTTTTTTTTTVKPSTINLKTFLKQQTETLSLSELLQTQNLSLADLIRGNKDASAILKARQSITSTTPTVKRKYNRVEAEPGIEQPPKKIEVVEVTTARPNYNRFQPKIPKIRPPEPKPTEEVLDDRQTKRQSFTSGFDPQSKLNEMRLKLRNYQRKTSTAAVQTEPTTAAAPVKDEPIEPTTPRATELTKKNVVTFKSTNNPELTVILPNKPKLESEKRLERPNWNRLPPVKRFGLDRNKQNELPLKVPIIVEESTEKELTTDPPEEERKPEPKDELIELLKSGQNADRLQKILKSRNMTLQELLENREKPPTDVNISQLFSSQEKTMTETTLFDSFPDFEREVESDYDEPEAEESAPNIARVQLIPNREAKQFPVPEKEESQLNLQPDDLTADKSKSESSALWKLSEKTMYYGSSYGYGDFAVRTEMTKTTTERDESDMVLLETVHRSPETNRKFKLDFSDFVREVEEPQTEDIEKSYIPPAVKSAIIASGVVMGIALFVFIAIFAACGWKQRQIRLKGSLGGTLKRDKRTTLSPSSFRDSSYKKSIDFDESSSESGTSNASSYLWSTLKHAFTSRASTLKSRQEKEEKLREDKITLRRNESRRKESRADDEQIVDERFFVRKLDRDRNVINTSFNFKRSNNVNHFNECVHGY